MASFDTRPDATCRRRTGRSDMREKMTGRAKRKPKSIQVILQRLDHHDMVTACIIKIVFSASYVSAVVSIVFNQATRSKCDE